MSAQGAQMDFPALVNDLLGMQSDVQTYAPSLASQWGWLAAQGKALVAGHGASVSQSAWVAQYRAFFAALQSAEGGQDQRIATNAWDMLTPGSVAEQAACSLTSLSTGAGQLATQAGQVVASPFTALSAFMPYIPWIIAGVAAIVIVPPLIRAFSKQASK